MKHFFKKINWSMVLVSFVVAIGAYFLIHESSSEAQSNRAVSGIMRCYGGNSEIRTIVISSVPQTGPQSNIITVQTPDGDTVVTNADCIIIYRTR